MEQFFSRKLTFIEFIKFVAPAVFSMIFISMYTIVDGIFVSTYVGSNALASINITLPITNIVCGFGVMMGTGGSAIIAKKLGENEKEKANSAFSLIFLASGIVGILCTVLGVIFLKDICILLGATDGLIEYCVTYARIIICTIPFFIIKLIVEYFTRAEGNFNVSLLLTIVGGLINILFDYIFIKVLKMGIAGAGLATGLGIIVSVIIGIWYFVFCKSVLKFKKPILSINILNNTIINGASEMITQVSAGFTTLLFNLIILKYVGEDGVAAFTIILYAQFLLVSAYIGFSAGIAPLISFNFGAKNRERLKESLMHSKYFLIISAILIFSITEIFAPNIVGIFVDTENAVFTLALRGLKLFGVSFLFVGINIFTSGLFTALSDGKTSGIVSICRAFIFVIIGLIVLPRILNLDGVWLTVPFAELATLLVSYILLNRYKRIYKIDRE